MRITLHFSSFICLLLLIPLLGTAQSFQTYTPGRAFTCITADSNGNIWAGTAKEGLYRLNRKGKPASKQFEAVSSGNLSTYNIQTLAADLNGNIWVGHNGIGGNSSSGGGIERIKMNTPSDTKHFSPDRNAMCFDFFERDGLATLNSFSLAVDTHGTVWSAHKYHDLFVSGPPSAQYIITPGGLSYKYASSEKFYSMSTYEDYRNGMESPELPYPIYTCNPPVWASPQTRNCYAVACGSNSVWLSVAPYTAINGSSFPARLLRYTPSGQYIDQHTHTSIGISGGGIFNGIWVNSKGHVWVTVSSGRVAVLDASGWYLIKFPDTFPASVIPNANAITGDEDGNVYIGTNQGLVVYNAKGGIFADSSYKIYSSKNGLPSSNVKGVAVDKYGSAWLATDAGISKFSTFSFTVYNLIHPEAGNEMNADKFALASAVEKDVQINGDSIDINVAADSTASTLLVYTGSQPQDKILKIVNAAVASDHYTPEFGELKELVRTRDSLVYLYRHPRYVYRGNNEISVSYSFVLKDEKTFLNVVEGRFKVFHTPVLLVHGVWSSIESMEQLEKYLLDNSGNYKNYQLLRIWHPNSYHYEYPAYADADRVPNGIDQLLRKCRDNRLSAGKVNIVAHSRGGLYSRYYLQEHFVRYRNDINSLITINTPHAGSQTANLILDKRRLLYSVDASQLGKLLQPMFLSKEDDPDGAIELKVTNDLIVHQLNRLPNLNRNKVPSHAITSQYQFNSEIGNFLLPAVVNGAGRIPYVGNVILAIRMYALIMGTFCLEGTADNCLKEIYDGEGSDIVVPLSSQKGGLEGKAISYLGNKIGHSKKEAALGLINVPSVTEVKETKERVTELLRQDPVSDASHFTRDGFHPDSLKYTFMPNLPGDPENGARIAAVDLTIDPAIKGKTYHYGDTVQVKVSGSADIKRLLIAYTGTSLAEASSDVEAGNSFTFPYPVPKEAAGKVDIMAYGFNDGGLMALDSSYILVGIPANATLDSIKIEKHGADTLEVPAGGSTYVSVLGYFSDTVRSISYLPETGYSFSKGGIVTTVPPNRLKGIIRGGVDRLLVNYSGKTDTVMVLVTDSIPAFAPESIPPFVTFTSFSGEFKNNEVKLNWNTARERDNKQFEVQHSTNGSDFNTIGVVAGKGTTNSSSFYTYSTNQFGKGENVYRLKQVSVDGWFTYSKTVTVNAADSVYPQGPVESFVSIYPNPARGHLVVSIHQPGTDKMQVRLCDAIGKTVLSKTITTGSGTESVSLTGIANGLYFVEIINNKNERILSGKLVVQ